MKAGQLLRPLLPAALKNKVPVAQPAGAWPTRTHARKMLLLDGCVQPAMAPNINAAAARVLDALGVQLVIAPRAGCCGAIRYHLNDQDGGLNDMRRNIDAWWPQIEAGAEAIVMTASGCGVTVKEYGHQLAHDPAYAAKARRVSELTKDLSEMLPAFESELEQRLGGKTRQTSRLAPAVHAAARAADSRQGRGAAARCRRRGATVRGQPSVLRFGRHLFGAAAEDLRIELRDNKLANLQATQPDMIVSANIGCITHLQSGTATPVRHWIEFIDSALAHVGIQVRTRSRRAGWRFRKGRKR